MKLLTKLKLRFEGVLKSVNLDWREVAVELMTDLFEERKRRFAFDGRIICLKQFVQLKKIKQLQKEMHAFSLAFLALQDIGLMPETEKGKAKAQTMHDVSHMIKDILDGKSVDEAMKRLEIVVEAEKVEQDDDSSRN